MPASLLDGVRLVIFDKDGTLIDFDHMWAGWMDDLARRLKAHAGAAQAAGMAQRLFAAFGYDAAARHALADLPLAVWPMAHLRDLALDVLRQHGLSASQAAAAVEAAWHTPDPVTTARPCADLPALFGALRARGVHIAVATSDDRAPTLATLAGLGLSTYVSAVICADDGLPAKPAPDMVFAACRAVGAAPGESIVVGDSVADMRMGRAAQAHRVVGVLSGVSAADVLGPHADALLPTVAGLLASEM